MVTHVHGAHTAAAGDGYTEAWWLPDAGNITCVDRDADGVLTATPTGHDPDTNTWNVACEGTIANQLTNRHATVVANTNNDLFAGQGAATFGYHNDQPSATLWYHDHSLGMTRINVYAGPAGFWLVRDAAGVGGETGLLAPSVLPAPAPVAGEGLLETNVTGRHKYREIPIVIQGRSFNTDGSLFYPDNRAFFEGLNVEGTAGTPDAQFPGAPELQIDMDPLTSDIAPIWNPEAFFNTMVVNGVTWPKLEVAPALYRFRLLNGANSRFLNLALVKGESGTSSAEIPFYQIGTEQSLSPQVVRVETGFATPLPGDGRDVCTGNSGKKGDTKTCVQPLAASDPMQALLMGLAERADVIVDFRGLDNGDIITMTNTAPDAPFGGFPDVPADPSTTGQVMQFVVNTALLGQSPTDELRDPNNDGLYVNWHWLRKSPR
jgi:FtsP/CotA-like multicopper oxidase with cupredoxin domain